MRRLLVLAALCFAVTLSFTHSAFANAIGAIDSGWYDENGRHIPDLINYCVGKCGGPINRNFFLFDLSAVETPIESALLQVFNPATGFGGADPFEVYVLYDVTTPIQALIDGTGGTQAWDDLGSGIELGTVTVTSADVATFIGIELNADAIASMNASPGFFAIGGALSSLDDAVVYPEYVFGNSKYSYPGAILHIPIPEPTPALLVACGLAGLAAAGRRRA